MLNERRPPKRRKLNSHTPGVSDPSDLPPDEHKKVCKKCIANRSSLKYAGPYVLGPVLGSPPVRSISQCLARKMGTDKFYTLKLLVMRGEGGGGKGNQDVKHGKMLIHTEYSLLSLLHDQEGVVHTYGLFQDEVEDPPPQQQSGVPPNNIAENVPQTSSSSSVAGGSSSAGGMNPPPLRTDNEQPSRSQKSDNPKSASCTSTGSAAGGRKSKRCKRLCLVVDCLTAHDYSPVTQDLVNLQHYVIKEKRLNERDALTIFLDIVRVVNDLHAKNIVHRDLKLGNIVLNKR